MQENLLWTPPAGPLGRLCRAARERAELLLPKRMELRDRARDATPRPSLAQALRAGGTVAIIAELKRRSPSKGELNAAMDAGVRSRLYAESGARALSILTEPTEFGGSADDLRAVAGAVAIPLLKKDFHVHELQVWEARALGASAMLFIARALAPELLRRLVELAVEVGVEPLIEVRSEAELEVALATPAQVIGVNARDLETLVIEPVVTERILPRIPSDRVRVAESGMGTPRDVARAATLGADAALIGSSLSAAADPAATLRALAGVPRGVHGG